MSRDFGIFMPKHLAGYYLLNSYHYINYTVCTARIQVANTALPSGIYSKDGKRKEYV